MKYSMMLRMVSYGFILFAVPHVHSEIQPLSAPTSIDVEKIRVSSTEGASAVFAQKGVLVFIETGSKCPIIRKYTPAIKELAKRYSNQPVQFFLVNSAAHDTKKTASDEAKDYDLRLPVLMDSNQNLAKALGFKMSTQAAVVNAETKEILYRGGIDDGFTFEGRKDAKNHYLRDAIDAGLKGELPKLRTARAFGCAITFK